MKLVSCLAIVGIVGVLGAFGCAEGAKYHPYDGGNDADAASASGSGGTTTGPRGSGGNGTGSGGAAIASQSGGSVGASGSGGISNQGSTGGTGAPLGTGGNDGTGGGAATGGTSSGGTASGGTASEGTASGGTSSGHAGNSSGGAVGSGGAPLDGGSALDAPSGADHPITCSATEKNCGGQCVTTTDPAYGCGATTCDSSSCPSPGPGGTVSCQAGACVIATCPTNSKKCGNKCVAVSDPAYGCGATTCDGTTCPTVGSGTLVCQGGSCVIGSCGAGTKKCGDKCVTTDANNGCSDTSRCTACASNEACMGSPTTCQCVPTPMATACNGKCGQVPNGCGGTYPCAMTCTPPQSCSGGGTPNVCGGCTKTPMATACSGKTCGTAADGCGGMYTCTPGCSGSTPDCVSNKCVECGSDSTCNANGYYKCSSNKCICRSESSDNLLKNAGFDGNSVSWNTGAGPTYDLMDSEGCPKSGSMAILSGDGLFDQCINTGLSGNREYKFGFRFKGNGEGRCIVRSFDGAVCTGQIISDPGGEMETTAISGGDWANASQVTATLPPTAVSVLIRCTGQPATGYFDELFFTQTVGGGGQF